VNTPGFQAFLQDWPDTLGVSAKGEQPKSTAPRFRHRLDEPSEAVIMSSSEVQAATLQGYVLGPDEDEYLVHWRDGGRIFIKIGSATRSGWNPASVRPKFSPVFF
jgi:hypothetical protein